MAGWSYQSHKRLSGVKQPSIQAATYSHTAAWGLDWFAKRHCTARKSRHRHTRSQGSFLPQPRALQIQRRALICLCLGFLAVRSGEQPFSPTPAHCENSSSSVPEPSAPQKHESQAKPVLELPMDARNMRASQVRQPEDIWSRDTLLGVMPGQALTDSLKLFFFPFLVVQGWQGWCCLISAS